MTNPHNVDICVTCVSEKPPQLPLREELPSLGIEVIYNAHGVGAKASKHASKKLIKRFREQEQVKELKYQPRFFPSSPKRVQQKQDDRQRRESELRIPHALSYTSYQKRLEGKTDSSSSSVSSWETHSSTLENSDAENKGKQQHKPSGRFQQHVQQPLSPTMSKNEHPPPPLKAVEFPTHSPEELALKEAFKVFSEPQVENTNDQHDLRRAESRETHKTPSRSSGLRDPAESRDQSSGMQCSSLTISTGVDNVPNQVQIVGSANEDQIPGLVAASLSSSRPSLDAPSSHDAHSSHETGENSTLATLKNLFTNHLSFKIHSTPAVQSLLPNLPVMEEESNSVAAVEGDSTVESPVEEQDDEPSTIQGGSTKSSSAKFSLIEENDQLTEFYDLTEISDDEGPIVFASDVAAASAASAASQSLSNVFDIDSKTDDSDSSKDLSTLSSKKDPPAVHRSNGIQVYPSPAIQEQLPGLRLHIPRMDDGYGRIVLDLSEVMEESGPGSPLVWSPNNRTHQEPEVIHSPQKRIMENDRMSDIRMTMEERQDNDIMESPTYPTRHTAHVAADGYGPYGVFPNKEEQEEERRPVYDTNMKSLFDEASSIDGIGVTSHSRPLSQGREPADASFVVHAEPEDDSLAMHSETEDGSFVIQAPRKSFSQDESGIHDYKSVEDSEVERLSDEESHPSPEPLSLKKSSTSHDGGRPLSPALKTSFSRDSEMRNLKVSFSHEVEQRYYESNEDEYRDSVDSSSETELAITSYEDCFKIANDEKQGGPSREDVGDLPGDLSMEADEAFDRLLDGETSYQLFGKSRDSQGQDEVRDPLNDFPEETEPVDTRSPEVRLLEALVYDSRLPEDFEKTLGRNPDLARGKLLDSDTYPLHAACVRELPDRFGVYDDCRVVDLVDDVVEMKKLVSALVKADPEICHRMDKDEDLPAHLMARHLMEWEAQWYQKVYEKAREESDQEAGSGAGITTLYQTMSQCIDILLKPIATRKELCKEPGSIGKLLPLQMAAIFTVSYDTLKTLLEAYPVAARVPCNLEDIRTFIPNASTPLELHNRLSTDFPKWEIENGESEDKEEYEIQWTQSKLDKSYGTKGGMRRSDLMFAFHPNVSPYRHETDRIRRLESRIRTEVSELEADEDIEVSLAIKLLWTWMCTFEGTDDDDDHYADSVKRIIQSLPARSVKLLAAIPADDGRPIIDKAIPQCTKAIRERLDGIAETDIPVPVATLSSGYACRQRSFLLRQWDEDMATRFCLQGRGFVGVLCRSLFNINEAMFPSSFVFLPYKLVKDDEGRLGLENAEAAAIAMQFADCLLHLTDSKKILHFLEKKAARFLGTSIRRENTTDCEKVDGETKEMVNRLLSLYEKGPAYFYFLDEYTGVPIVPENNSIYPLVVGDAVDMVRKCLPIMLSGMILMRGEKALSVIAKVLLDQNVELVQSHWVDAAKDLVGYLYSPQTEWTNGYLQDLLPLRDDLLDFIERGPSEDAPELGHRGLASEWVVELSLVKMIVEMHDSNHTHSGLRPRRAGLKVLWTRDAAFLNPDSRDHLYQMDFKSLLELKEASSLKEVKALDVLQKKEQEHQPSFEEATGRDSPEVSVGSAFDMLFQELSLVGSDSSSSSAEAEKEDTQKHDAIQLLSRARDLEPTFRATPPLITRTHSYASAAKPISLLDFDDDLDLDDVLQLRILLDEQEAKLEFLKDKIDDLEEAETELLEQEERLGDMLGEINSQKNDLLKGTSNKGLSQARNLLLRICSLEDRVLCREVEVGQLKNDISCFELEASQEGLDVFLLDAI